MVASPFPCLDILTNGVSSALRRTGRTVDRVTVVAREPNVESSRCPSEIVTCQLDGDTKVRLLCKRVVRNSPQLDGRRDEMDYEAAVYDRLLQSSSMPRPTFYGIYTDASTNSTWLLLEYLGKYACLDQAPAEPPPMPLAAQWIGRFHADSERSLRQSPLPFLRRGDAEYYRRWVRRTVEFARGLPHPPGWLPDLCDRFEPGVALLLAPPLTVIHGDYYPQNILVREGGIYPVDWESAAVAAGEIDLASLTEGWPANTVQECEAQYCQARWPEGAPPEFAPRLAAARVYWCLRWLGERPPPPGHSWFARRLQSVGERLGLVEA